MLSLGCGRASIVQRRCMRSQYVAVRYSLAINKRSPAESCKDARVRHLQ